MIKCFSILMSQKAGRIGRWLVGVIMVAVLAAIVIWKAWPPRSNSPKPKSAENHVALTSRPATAISSWSAAPVVLAHETSTFLDVVRDHYPDFPATQALPFPLDLPQAGRLGGVWQSSSSRSCRAGPDRSSGRFACALIVSDGQLHDVGTSPKSTTDRFADVTRIRIRSRRRRRRGDTGRCR